MILNISLQAKDRHSVAIRGVVLSTGQMFADKVDLASSTV